MSKGENKGELNKTDKENKENEFLNKEIEKLNKEIEDVLLNLVNEARMEIKRVLQATNEEERKKTKEELREILFKIGRIDIMSGYYGFILELQNDIELKEKYADDAYKEIVVLTDLKYKD